jgi:hypothetical protein
MQPEPEPIACRLTTADAARQALEWTDLQPRSSSTIAIDGGARMRFPADLADLVGDLAAREATCCSFLTITTRLAGDELELDITSDQPEAAPVISLLTGISEPGEAST